MILSSDVVLFCEPAMSAAPWEPEDQDREHWLSAINRSELRRLKRAQMRDTKDTFANCKDSQIGKKNNIVPLRPLSLLLVACSVAHHFTILQNTAAVDGLLEEEL